ncbi:MAG: phosphotransferase family protein [Acidimicrobiia bacterium]|nr:phosphotransferase family protein [Acidimicrobiia bacterium]
MPVSENRDLAQVRADLEGWLGARWRDHEAGATGVSIDDLVAPEGAGFSNETLLGTLRFEVDGEERAQGIVVRLRPDYPVFPTYDLQRQFTVMQCVRAAGVRVPEMYFYEDDESVLGSPFHVGARVAGRIPRDAPPYHAEGWMAAESPALQRRVWEEGIDTLAAVAGVDWRSAGLGFLDPGDGVDPLAHALDEYEAFLTWAADGRDYPVQTAALAWLRSNAPGDTERALSWGDARIGNIIYDSHCRTVAVLDWEMCAIGSPEWDLAWTLFVDWHHSDGFGIPRMASLPGRDETIARWEERMGRRARDLEYYEVFAAFRFAVIYVRLDWLVKRSGLVDADSGDLGSANPCVAWLRDNLGPT